MRPHGAALTYVPGLDGIRAFAVLLVAAFHARVPGATGGFIGVDVFFVLSGYLITALLLAEIDRTGTVDLRDFWRRRMVRLFPALAAMIAAFLCVAPWLTLPPQAPALQSLVSLIYMADYVRAFTDIPDYLGHCWSLAVEAKFYLVWPLILTVVARRLDPKALVRAIVLLAIAAASWRMMNLQLFSWDMVYYRADTRLSGMLIGSSLAAALRAGFHLRVPSWAGFAPLALFPVLWGQYGDTNMLSHAAVLVEMATALLILAVLQGSGPVAKALALLPAVWLGKLSYGIYLWHYPIMRALRDEFHWTSTLLIGLPLSLALAWASLHTIERWSHRHRSAQPHFKSTAA